MTTELGSAGFCVRFALNARLHGCTAACGRSGRRQRIAAADWLLQAVINEEREKVFVEPTEHHLISCYYSREHLKTFCRIIYTWLQ